MRVQKIQRKKGIVFKIQTMYNYERISKTFKTYEAAQQFAKQLDANKQATIHAFKTNKNDDPLKMGFSELVDEYLESDAKASYKKSILRWWADAFKQYKIETIQRRHVKEALFKLSQYRTPATCNRYKSALSTVFVYLLDEYDIDFNPVKKIRGFTENNARTRFLSTREFKALIRACKRSKWDRLAILVLLAVTTGARRGELIKLKWSDVNFDSRTILLQKTKNGSKRVLTLTKEASAELQKYRIKTGYVFPALSKHKSKTYFKTFDYHWRVALDDAQIRGLRFHDLRHTCASFLAMNGATLLEIADVLGHKSISMTHRYSHLCTSHKHALTDKVFGSLSL